MWTVEQPNFDAGTTFEICISRVRNAELRRRLTSVGPTIAAAAVNYEAMAEAKTLNLVAASESVAGVVTKAEMVQVYDQRMAGKGGPGRAIYDRIKLLPDGDRCPFCDQRNISTLDHILPKTRYPCLAVMPLNLVGACMECNKAKSSLEPQNPEQVVLHPYFDDITASQWLVADVVQQTPCAIVFDIVRPPNWDNVTEARAKAQFGILGLPYLYSSEAGRELANIRHNLRAHFDAGGAAAVQHELMRQWRSRRANRLNSWQTAMYETIANDTWFCNGGFD
jgi:hypothetical protein